MPLRRLLARLALAAPLALTAGCAQLQALAPQDDSAAIAKAVEPTLRAAAANAEAQGDWRGAVQHWGTLYQRNPADRGVALSLSRALRLSGQPDGAAEVSQAMLARKADDVDAMVELGKAWIAGSRAPLAAQTLEKATALAPTRWDAWNMLGVAYDQDNRFAAATEAYGKALAQSPDNVAVLTNLGLSQALAGKLDDGIATLNHASAQPRADAQTRQNLALLLALKGDTAGAERLARRDLPPDAAKTNAELYKALARARN